MELSFFGLDSVSGNDPIPLNECLLIGAHGAPSLTAMESEAKAVSPR